MLSSSSIPGAEPLSVRLSDCCQFLTGPAVTATVEALSKLIEGDTGFATEGDPNKPTYADGVGKEK